MIKLALTSLPLLWLVWLAGLWADLDLVAWVVPLAKIVVGIGLCGVEIQDSPPIQRFLRFFGLTFLLLALADSCWIVAFPRGQARLGDTLWILPIYLASAAVGTHAGLIFFAYMHRLFGFSSAWFWVPVGVGVGVGVLSYWFGVAQLASYSPRDLLAFWLNIALGVISSFTTAILVGLAVSTWGGSFFRWITPAGLGFSLLVVANMVYSDQGETYTVGSLTDWLYLLGTSVFFVYLRWGVRAGRALNVGDPAA